jgi:hypothetical protein
MLYPQSEYWHDREGGSLCPKLCAGLVMNAQWNQQQPVSSPMLGVEGVALDCLVLEGVVLPALGVASPPVVLASLPTVVSPWEMKRTTRDAEREF